MKCWKCGQDNGTETGPCAGCGASLDKPAKKPAGPATAEPCPGCGATRLKRGQKKIGSGDGAKYVSVVQCEACSKVYDKDSPTYYKFFQFLYRPGSTESPIKVGGKGKLGEVEYEVLGRVRYQDEDDYKPDAWDEWYLVSQFGERGWLVYEKGKFRLYTRHKPAAGLETDGRSLVYDGKAVDKKSYNARIVHIEGQLPWNAEIGEATQCWDFARDGQAYCVEKSAEEVEPYVSSKLPARDVIAAFGNQELSALYDQTAAKRRLFKLKARVWFWSALACLAGGIYSCSQGETAAKFSPRDESLRPDQVKVLAWNRVAYGPFTLSRAGSIHRVIVNCGSLSTEQVEATATLLNAKGEPVFGVNVSFWHETGYDDEGYWSESSLSGDGEFVLDENGPYTLQLEVETNKAWRDWRHFAVELTQGERSYWWLHLAFFLFLMTWLVARTRARHFNALPFAVRE